MIKEKVKKLIASQLNIPVEKVEDNSKLIEDLGADSLDIVEMLMTLEDEFNVTVSDDEAIKLKTVEDIVKIIEATQSK